MNIFSYGTNEEILKVEEPPTPTDSPELEMNIVNNEVEVQPNEWFWARWYRQRQDSFINDIVDRAARLNMRTSELMFLEERQYTETTMRVALWGVIGVSILSAFLNSRGTTTTTTTSPVRVTNGSFF